MEWNFCTANHNATGRSSLVDMLAFLKAGLESIGHDVLVSQELVFPDRMNVFFENFRSYNYDTILKADVPFGLIATEIPTGQTFNWQDNSDWQDRYQAFKELAPNAAFIWVMVESTLPFYETFGPAGYLELGFVEELHEPRRLKTDPKDFYFLGQKTPYRYDLLDKISKRASLALPEIFLSADEMIRFQGEGKVSLNLRQSDEWPVPSPTKLARSLMSEIPISLEYVPELTRQSEILGMCPQDIDFIDYSLGILESDWSTKAKKNLERFKKEMPMAQILRDLINRTLAKNIPFKNGPSEIITFCAEPTLSQVVGSFNIIEFDGEFHALSHTLGELDVVEFLKGSTVENQSELYFKGTTLEQVVKQAQFLERLTSPKDQSIKQRVGRFFSSWAR